MLSGNPCSESGEKQEGSLQAGIPAAAPVRRPEWRPCFYGLLLVADEMALWKTGPALAEMEHDGQQHMMKATGWVPPPTTTTTLRHGQHVSRGGGCGWQGAKQPIDAIPVPCRYRVGVVMKRDMKCGACRQGQEGRGVMAAGWRWW